MKQLTRMATVRQFPLASSPGGPTEWGEHMKHLMWMMVRFHHDRAGLTIVEYAVAGGVITVAVVAAFLTLGDAVAVSIAGLADRIRGS